VHGEFSKIKNNGTIHVPTIPLLGIVLGEMKPVCPRESWTCMLIAALFTIAKKQK
jgi:hypothetical protein